MARSKALRRLPLHTSDDGYQNLLYHFTCQSYHILITFWEGLHDGEPDNVRGFHNHSIDQSFHSLFNKLHTGYITKNNNCAAYLLYLQYARLLCNYVCRVLYIADTLFLLAKTVNMQIRVHLKHIGYPIANDELYLSGNFCPRLSKGTSINRATSLAYSSLSSDPYCCAEADAEFDIDAMCTNCPNLAPVG
jgi:hypothetical protein